MAFTRQKLTIATRESPLALWQANYIAELLRAQCPGLGVELLGITTQGDKMLAGPLSSSGGKGLFVKELEQAMLDGRADLAVHSAKDMPAELPDGLALMPVGQRGDVRDALVLREGSPASLGRAPDSPDALGTLPRGAVVGTASQRRLSQLRSLRPDLDCRPLRGNVNTRLRKLDAGEFDAIVLAAAGLQRLGFAGRVSALLPVSLMLPAAGQGALALEYAAEDLALATLLQAFADRATTLCVTAERAFSARLEGGCQLPIAALAVLQGNGELALEGRVGALDGKRLLSHRDNISLDLPGNGAHSEAAQLGAAAGLGRALADTLIERGARDLLAGDG